MTFSGRTKPDEPSRRSTLLPDYQRNWPAYFDAVAGQPPRDTLLRGLAVFDDHRLGERALLAVDLACGEGRDTRAILAHSERWRVLAIDRTDEGLKRLAAGMNAKDAMRVVALRLGLEDVSHASGPAEESVQLINASFALPFCDERAFPTLWTWIRTRLAPGGVFCGQFFGDRDEWHSVNPLRHHTRAQVQALLDGLIVLHFDEVEKDGDDAMGGRKHHHVFHVVAQRSPA